MSQPTATFQLRPFALSDADSVAPWLTGPGLSLPLGSTAWPERILRDQRILALVGWAGDERLGLLRLDCGPDGVADVTIVVSPEHRRSGFGRRILPSIRMPWSGSFRSRRPSGGRLLAVRL